MPNHEWILEIYVSAHCAVCAYAYEVAEHVRRDYAHVKVRLIDMEQVESFPESVFATPTYLLNGQVWSLGNPSSEKIQQSFASHMQTPDKLM